MTGGVQLGEEEVDRHPFSARKPDRNSNEFADITGGGAIEEGKPERLFETILEEMKTICELGVKEGVCGTRVN